VDWDFVVPHPVGALPEVKTIARVKTHCSQTTNPGAARRALLIWTAIERLQEFPALGMQTEDADVRQIVIRFGTSGYIVRYTIISETADILVTRVWHGREARI
jgi:toxin ParE1/3/4